MSSTCRPSIVRDSRRHQERGAALVLALSLLAIFGILGTSYIKYMNLSLEESDQDLRVRRADHLAVAGVEFALEGLRMEVMSPNHSVQKGETIAGIPFDSYFGISDGESGVVTQAMPQERLATADVTVYDESGRLNINHASPDALQKLLGVDANTARKIASSVPRGGQSGDKKWFLALDELVTRGFLTQDQFDLVIPTLLTTFSVEDHANPARHLNVNSADPAVLAAVLNLSMEQAAQVKAKAPFPSLTALSDAVAAVTGSPAPNIEGDTALVLESRCFRIVSKSRYAKIIDKDKYDAATTPEERDRLLRNSARGRIETVVLFEDDGSYRVIQWNTRGEAIDADPA